MSDSFFSHSPSEEKPAQPQAGTGAKEETESSTISEDRRMTALMAYVPFLCFAPLLKMRDDPYVYFHARQGLVLFFLEIIAFVFSFPHLSQLFWIATIIGCIGAAVAGVMFSAQGRTFKIPIIGDIAEKLKL